MQLKSISPSDLNRVGNCPRNWMYSKTKKVGVVVPIAPMLYGSALHNIMVLYFQKIPDKPTEEDIEVTAKEAFDEGKTHAMKSFRAKTQKVLENFIKFEKLRLKSWKQYKPTFVEKWKSAKIWDDIPEFHIIIDFYGESDETIIDWKFGKGGRDNTTQGNTYRMVLNKLGFPVKKVLFVNLNVGTHLQSPRVTEGWIYKLSKRLVEMARLEMFPKNPGWLCNFCRFILSCQLENRCIWLEM